jgi:DNA-binding NtrC family response regulator
MDGKNPGGLSILVVDDDEDMRKLICAMLKRMNVNLVTEAQNGEEALERISAARAPFSIVICDWEMPRISGIDLFKQVHATYPELPFLMLTGRSDLESVVAAKKAGIMGYLVKPISPLQLRTKIAALL